MRYVEYIPPLPERAVEAEQPVAVSGIQPAKRVQPRSMPPLVLQRRRSNEAKVQGGVEMVEPHAERRAEETQERRKLCRRVGQEAVLLDTRSGHDRRCEARREDDHLDASVDTKV